jgi:polyhydroxyalkanoate synthesis regulator phasin
VEYGTLQESFAVAAWRKNQRIELLKTIAVVTGSVNPQQAQKALRNLIEEMFPEVAEDREKAVERALSIMEEEKKKTYAIAPVGHGLNKGAFGRIRNILKQKRRPGR